MSTVRDRKALEYWRKKVQFVSESTHLENPFETDEERGERISRAKKEYAFFIKTYFPHLAKNAVPDFHAEAANKVKRNPNIKIWLQWGRGLAKSVLADILIPLWLWINDDIQFMVLIGENADKAAILLEDLRAEFEANQRLIHDFGTQKNVGQWEKGFFITKNGFIAKSLGMGQSPRGLRVGAHRPDYIAPDDWENRETKKNPKRQDELSEWLLRDVIPSADGNLRVLLAQNKFAPRMIFDKVIEENKAWNVFRINAYNPSNYIPVWPEKYTPDYYRKIEEVIGVLAAHAEYNNEPHIEGKIFTHDQIQWAKLPRLDHFEVITGYWDVAFAGTPTSDYNAVRVWGLYKGYKYLLDCFLKQSKVKDPLLWISYFQKSLPESVKVWFRFESQFWNEEIYRTISEVEEVAKIQLLLSKSERSTVRKYDRILTMHPSYQNGRVFYNEKLKNHNDTKQGIAQLLGIEPGYNTKDDAPDADQYAFDYMDQFTKTSSHQYRAGKRKNRRY